MRNGLFFSKSLLTCSFLSIAFLCSSRALAASCSFTSPGAQLSSVIISPAGTVPGTFGTRTNTEYEIKAEPNTYVPVSFSENCTAETTAGDDLAFFIRLDWFLGWTHGGDAQEASVSAGFSDNVLFVGGRQQVFSSETSEYFCNTTTNGCAPSSFISNTAVYSIYLVEEFSNPTPTSTDTSTSTGTGTSTSTTYSFALSADNSTLENYSAVSIVPSTVKRVDPITGASCGQNAPSKKTLLIQCVDSATLAPVVGCSASASLSMGRFNGGHDHDDGFRSLGRLDTGSSVFSVDPLGSPVTYEAAEISQEVKMTVSGKDPNGRAISPASIYLRTQTAGSDSWVGLSGGLVHVILDGADPSPSHALGFFGTPAMDAAVAFLGANYSLNLSEDPDYGGHLPPAPLVSQAASLPWGGLYDIHQDWQNPHCGHRKGTAMDFSIGDLTSVQKKALLKAFKQSGLKRNNETDHWHVDLK